MREIKFRAWDKGNKIWQYFTLDELSQGVNKDFHQFLENWCQFTGLKDKNGKEIYEGDIGKRKLDEENRFGHDEEWADFWLVEWLDKTAGFTTTRIGELDKEKIKHCELKRNSFSTRFNEIEIIGNIYENPELLEHPFTK